MNTIIISATVLVNSEEWGACELAKEIGSFKKIKIYKQKPSFDDEARMDSPLEKLSVMVSTDTKERDLGVILHLTDILTPWREIRDIKMIKKINEEAVLSAVAYNLEESTPKLTFTLIMSDGEYDNKSEFDDEDGEECSIGKHSFLQYTDIMSKILSMSAAEMKEAFGTDDYDELMSITPAGICRTYDEYMKQTAKKERKAEENPRVGDVVSFYCEDSRSAKKAIVLDEFCADKFFILDESGHVNVMPIHKMLKMSDSNGMFDDFVNEIKAW